MKVTPTFLISSLARNDISRITGDLYDLQRQTGSGFLADDLRGYGDDAGRLITARTVIAQTDARQAIMQRLQARLDLQDAALDKTAKAADTLKINLLEALGNENGTYVEGQLRAAFSDVLSSLNLRYEGQNLFSGEQRGASTVRVTAVQDLLTAVTDAQVFNESARQQTIDVGLGAPFVVADKASDISRGLFDAFRTLYTEIQAGALGNPMTDAQRTTLTTVVAQLETARETAVDAQGRNGLAIKRLGREVERLTAQSNLIENHADQIAGADLAEVSMKIAATQTQYQAIAKVFSDIRNLTLLNFLD